MAHTAGTAPDGPRAPATFPDKPVHDAVGGEARRGSGVVLVIWAWAGSLSPGAGGFDGGEDLAGGADPGAGSSVPVPMVTM